MNEKNALQLILLEGEGYKTEFKEKTANLDREIVAFANGAGGSVFLGVDDNGQVIGIDITNRLKSQVVDIARNCDPAIQIKLISHNEKKVLEVLVAEGRDKPYRCKDGFFLRVGSSSQKLKRDEIVTFINHAGKIHFDETLNNVFRYPRDFSQEWLMDFLKHCGISTKFPNKDILLSLNVAEQNKNLVFNNSGVLFFAKSPQKFYPESYITAVKYGSYDRLSIIDKKDFFGTPIQQIELAMAFMMQNMGVALDIPSNPQAMSAAHKKCYDYPLSALREAIVNAVTHRDYFYDGTHIYIHMYPDHIDIENPGGLYHGLSLEDLGKRSVRRNRLIADLLHRANYIERVGSGFDRMKRSLAENNNPPLEVNATNFFNIRFYKRIANISATALTERQMRLYHFLHERQTVTKRDVAIMFNISDDTAVRELNALLALKVITKHGIGKATVYTTLNNEKS